MEVAIQTEDRSSKTKEYHRQYVRTHEAYREKNLQRSKERYEKIKADPEKYAQMREYQRKYREEHAERIRFLVSEHRQKKKQQKNAV